MEMKNNGQPSIMGMVQQIAGSNANDIAKNVKKVLEEQSKSFPPGMVYKFNQDVTVPELSASDTYDVEGFLTVYKGQLELYPIKVVKHGDFVKGDVNGDGEVTLADVNLLIDIILGGQDNTNGRSDVNGDGEANIADVNEVIDIILNN